MNSLIKLNLDNNFLGESLVGGRYGSHLLASPVLILTISLSVASGTFVMQGNLQVNIAWVPGTLRARWGVVELIERPLLMLKVRGLNPGHSI